MHICAIVKYPPIQGGVSRFNWRLIQALGQAGHQVTVVTNASEVESNYRLALMEEDKTRLTAHYDSGGWVKLLTTTPMSTRYRHIPSTNPYVSKLASLATDAIVENGCELIFASYFEPYCIAAQLASEWTDIPFVVQHAGSDLSRLMNQPDLARSYKEMLRRADGILTHNPRPFLGIGISRENIYEPERPQLPEWFSPSTCPMDLNTTVSELRNQGFPLPNTARIDPAKFTIGMYGKPGPFKGAKELVESVSRLRQLGCEIQLISVSGLSESLQRTVIESGISDSVWMLPFLAPWQIPHFIAACSAVAFLEHDFPVKFHTPSVASEVLASGKCLITTREIIDKQGKATSAEFVSGENVVIVDPWCNEELDKALYFTAINLERLDSIGKSGRQVFMTSRRQGDLWVYSYERIFESVLERRINPMTSNRGLEVQLPDVLRWLPRTAEKLPNNVLLPLWESFRDQRTDTFKHNDLYTAWDFARHILNSEGLSNDDTIRWDEVRLWQWLDDPNRMVFGVTDQYALRQDVSLDEMRPVKNRFMRVESLQGKRLLFIRTPNLIDSPVLEINSDVEALLHCCTGELTVQRLQDSVCPQNLLKDRLLSLYEYGALVFI